MFLVRWMRTLLSLPFALLGQGLALVNVPLDCQLLRIAWRIGGNERIGQQALMKVESRRGLIPAMELGFKWMATRPSPGIAGLMGLRAMKMGDQDTSRSLYTQGRQLGDDPSGLLDLLEVFFVLDEHDDGQTAELFQRFEARRDLTPAVSRLVATEHLWFDMLAGRFGEACRRAEWMLEISDSASAEMALWALAEHRDDAPRSQVHWQRAGSDEGGRLYYQAFGLASIGREDEARDLIPTVRNVQAGSAAQLERMLAEREGGA